jgi:Bacterial low temperature requirement A protein (LtrA)
MNDRQVEAEQRVTPLELFFDLVFVFAITQVTGFLATDPTWGGLLRGLMMLAALWWAWAAYAWLTNTLNQEEGAVRRPRAKGIRPRGRLMGGAPRPIRWLARQGAAGRPRPRS